MFNKNKENKVTCCKCKCWLSKEDAQKVEISFPCDLWSVDNTEYYCLSCKVPYQRKSIIGSSIRRYYKEVQVDSEGEPIGYKKVIEKESKNAIQKN